MCLGIVGSLEDIIVLNCVAGLGVVLGRRGYRRADYKRRSMK
jgi:hypothetical protein